MALSPRERDIAIRTIIGEAGNQGYQGQLAVASVIQNRANSGAFPSTWEGVIMQPGQFSVWNDTTGYAGGAQGATSRMMSIDPNSAQYQNVGKIVDDVSAGRVNDPTGGATHYYNPSVSQPRWGIGNPSWQSTGNIGAHTFGIANSRGDGRGGTIPESAWGSDFTLDQSRATAPATSELGLGGALSGIGGANDIPWADQSGTGWMSGNDGFGSYQGINQGASIPYTYGGANETSWVPYSDNAWTGSSGGWYDNAGFGSPNYTNQQFSGGSTVSSQGTSTSTSGWTDVGSYDPATGQWNTTADGAAPTEAQQTATQNQQTAQQIQQGPGSSPQGQAGSIPQAIVTAANQLAQQQQKAADYETKATTGIVSNVLNVVTNLFSRAVVIILGFIFVAAGLSMFGKGVPVVRELTGGIRQGLRGG